MVKNLELKFYKNRDVKNWRNKCYLFKLDKEK